MKGMIYKDYILLETSNAEYTKYLSLKGDIELLPNGHFVFELKNKWIVSDFTSLEISILEDTFKFYFLDKLLFTFKKID